MARPTRPHSLSDVLNSVWDKDAGILRIYLVQREDLGVLLHPFATGTLTTSGTLFTTAFVTGTGGTYEEAAVGTLIPAGTGTLLELELGLTAAIKSSATADNMLAKWQARNTGGTWADITAVETYSLPTANTLKEITFSGRPTIGGSLTRVPFELRFMVNSGTTTGTAQVKNSSYVLVRYNEATG